MEVKFPFEKGRKIWIEVEALETCDICEHSLIQAVSPLFKLDAPYHITAIIVNLENYANNEVLNELERILRSYGRI